MTDPVPGADPAEVVGVAMTGIEGLAERPLAEHVAVFDDLHTALSDALAGPSGPA